MEVKIFQGPEKGYYEGLHRLNEESARTDFFRSCEKHNVLRYIGLPFCLILEGTAVLHHALPPHQDRGSTA